MKRIVNPFVYLGGGRALAWGIVGLLATAAIATWSGQTFRGIVSVGYGDWPLWKTTVAQLLIWGVFASLLYAAGLLLSRSRIRAIDVYGTNLFARLPFVLLVALASLTSIRDYLDSISNQHLNQLEMTLPPVSLLLFALAVVFVLIWYFTWTYNAFVVSTNLRGGRAIASFLVCYVLAEVLSGLIWIGIF